MDVRKVFIKGFGQIKDREIDFGEGINIIYAENEGGKSTLHSFIEAMFYHNYKVGIKKRIRDEKIIKYEPWDGSAYSGSMSIFDDEKIIHIEKDFLSKNPKVKIYDEHAKDLSADYEMDEVFREPNFAKKHLGLSKIMFKNTVSLAQMSSATDETVLAELKKYISNIEKTNDATISVNKVIEKIKEEKDLIGSARKSKSPYALREKRLKELASKLIEAEETQKKIANLREVEDKLKLNLEEISKQIKENNNDLEELNKLEKNKIKEEADKLFNKISFLEGEVAELKKFEKFSYQRVLELKELESEIRGFDKSKQSIIEEAKNLQNEKLELDNSLLASSNVEDLSLQKKLLKKDLDKITQFQREIDLENENLGQKKEELRKFKELRLTLKDVLLLLSILLVALGFYLSAKSAFYLILGAIILLNIFFYFWHNRKVFAENLEHQVSEIGEIIKIKKDDIDSILADRGFAKVEDLEEKLDEVGLKLSLSMLKREEELKVEKKIKGLDLKIKDKYDNLDEILYREGLSKDAFAKAKQDLGLVDLDHLDDFYLKGKQYSDKKSDLDFSKKMLDEKLGDLSYGELCFEQLDERVENLDRAFLERKKESLSKNYYSEKEKLEKVAENIRILEEGGFSIQEVEEEIETLEARRAEDDKRLKVLDIVLEKIAFSIENIQRTVMPKVNKSIAEVVSVATDGKYDDIKVSAQLKVFLKDKSSGKLVELENLSMGSIDLIYIGLRIALASLANGDKKIPLFFDDSFSQIDETRLKRLLSYLSGLDRQILIFTCHKREKKILDLLSFGYEMIEM